MVMFGTPLAETLRRRTATLTGAILIGLVALAFAACADEAQRAFGWVSQRIGLATLIVVPGAFAILSYLTGRFAPEARGSGIPQVIAAAPLARPELSPLLSLKTATAKFLLTIGGLLVGASSGREGPTVQISAAIMVGVHRFFRVPLTAAVTIAGGAAGVSAAFNTPLAGIAFALEELAAAYEQRLALLAMAAVVIAGLVSLSLAGDYLYFGSLRDSLSMPAGLVAVPIIAVVGGASGAAFSRLVLMFNHGALPALTWLKQHRVLFAAGCGLLIAVAGLASAGATLGTGYGPAKALIEGASEPATFAPAKFVASLATTISGVPGGVFAPSLSVGAGLGGLLAPLFGSIPPGVIALVAMTAYFVGVVRAPLTSVIIIMEMTDSRSMLLVLLATALISEGVASLLCPERLYHGLAKPFRAPAGHTPKEEPPALAG
jgi:H+/Cl- antiporter ClcA